MAEYSKSLSNGNLKEDIPYLLKFYFRNNPTSSRDLSEAFWKLMGKDIKNGKVTRWSSSANGVPHQIHLLVRHGILKDLPHLEDPSDNEYKEYKYRYELGDKGQNEIDILLSKHSKDFIDKEIETYLGNPQHITTQSDYNA
jgi:hypothetical protein